MSSTKDAPCQLDDLSAENIVLIDDEPMILQSLSAFLELEGFRNVHCFDRGATALAYIEDKSADLVISDMLLPQMDGIEILARVRRLDPRIPRILLTGYADKDSAIRAINQAGLFSYLEKPWSNDHLAVVVRNALERRALLRCLSQKAAELDIANGRLEELQTRVLRAFM